MAVFRGDSGDNNLTGGLDDDKLYGGYGDDTLLGGGGDDHLRGGRDDDILIGGAGDDDVLMDLRTAGSDTIDLGTGNDRLIAYTQGSVQVRLTFTSSEVGDGSATDSDTLPGQDGKLAVRLQAEVGDTDALGGSITRIDDEGLTFLGYANPFTFDVRDLASGEVIGVFHKVRLGTANDDFFEHSGRGDTYINAGWGDDVVRGSWDDDFLVGGAGNDILDGSRGEDTFVGGTGDDTILPEDVRRRPGDDCAIFNVSSDGSDTVNLGSGSDRVEIGAEAPGQVRLTFSNAEVGNGNPNDSNTLPRQDGGLAVRLQGENGSDGLTGDISRFDDEGVTFVATTPGVSFDVRDLVSGAAHGDQFDVVVLGSDSNDTLAAVESNQAHYFSAGLGDDRVNGSRASDVLVGGSGRDALVGAGNSDTLAGGGDRDILRGGLGDDIFVLDAPFNAAVNLDHIRDFGTGDDRIQLDSAVFKGLTPGTLTGEAFALMTSGPEADDRIIYDQATGNLCFDATGGGREDAVIFANLTNKALITAGDFFIV